jgi:hypothetical protein
MLKGFVSRYVRVIWNFEMADFFTDIGRNIESIGFGIKMGRNSLLLNHLNSIPPRAGP